MYASSSLLSIQRLHLLNCHLIAHSHCTPQRDEVLRCNHSKSSTSNWINDFHCLMEVEMMVDDDYDDHFFFGPITALCLITRPQSANGTRTSSLLFMDEALKRDMV